MNTDIECKDMNAVYDKMQDEVKQLKEEIRDTKGELWSASKEIKGTSV
jgi:phage shock protein A